MVLSYGRAALRRLSSTSTSWDVMRVEGTLADQQFPCQYKRYSELKLLVIENLRSSRTDASLVIGGLKLVQQGAEMPPPHCEESSRPLRPRATKGPWPHLPDSLPPSKNPTPSPRQLPWRLPGGGLNPPNRSLHSQPSTTSSHRPAPSERQRRSAQGHLPER